MCYPENITEYAVEMAQLHYEQELSRHERILTKSHYLLSYISIIFSILSITSVFILGNFLTIDKRFNILILFAYVYIITLIILTVWFSLKVQYIDRLWLFPSGEEFIKHAYKVNISHIKEKFYCLDDSGRNLYEICNNNSTHLRKAYYFFMLIFIYFLIIILEMSALYIFYTYRFDIYIIIGFNSVFTLLSVMYYFRIKGGG